MSIEREMDELNRWAAELTQRVYHEWVEKYSWWRPGFKTLIGSPIIEPSIAIITLNPGRRNGHLPPDQYVWAELETLRSNNGYLLPSRNAPYCKSPPDRMVRAIQRLFGEHCDMLYYEAVAFPAFFFRSSGWDEIREHFRIPHPTRREAKNFCFPIVREMVEKLQPKRLLVVGHQPYRYLNEDILGLHGQREAFVEKDRISRSTGTNELALESEWHSKWGVLPVFRTPHLTGTRPALTNNEWGTLGERFHHWLSISQLVADS